MGSPPRQVFSFCLDASGCQRGVAEEEGDKLVSAGVRMPASGVRTTDLQLYAGPKEYDTLRSLNVGLEETIDFGWFIFGSWSVVKAVAKPFLCGAFHQRVYAQLWCHDHSPDHGHQVLFVPLQYKSYKSMKQMQLVQPKVLALQEKYKDDRDKLNKELIKLYRDHKVNPVGGCLPMVLQMPSSWRSSTSSI